MADKNQTMPTDELLAPYIRITEADRLPDAPRVRLCMEASPRLSTTLPYDISFHLERDDDDPRPCMVRWSAYLDMLLRSNLVLFRHVTGADGSARLERVDVGPDPMVGKYKSSRYDDGWLWGSGYRWVELPPGGRSPRTASGKLPERYHKLLVPGQRYELLYPGGEASVWVWGTERDYLGTKLSLPIVGLRTPGAEVEEELPRVVMPGGTRLGFVAETEAVPWPSREEHEAELGFTSANNAERVWRWDEAEKRRAPDPIKASERVLGTPILVVTLNCPPELVLHKSLPGSTTFELQARVTYDAAPTSEKPITFRTRDLWHLTYQRSRREGYELYKHHDLDEGSDEQEWQVCDMDDGEEGCAVCAYDFDGPDIKVHVREDSEFISLRPGESWTTTCQLQTPAYTALPKNVRAGDRFRYQFLGAANVDWWDWGHVDNEHAETVVTLPSCRGRVVDPADNGGRPKLVVPGSDPVEFRIVG
ncbi:hypothetical protein B0I37DRAFT_364920 [Chaetomium sp. MPI-CAGE-AT-0009]|nr:hypothetical protein B0I37DRAFT_364920 [Chaetomium sp. MPI-CAGE-AT-0009]